MILSKRILAERNRFFLEKGITSLHSKGFEKSPFSTAPFGQNNVGGYTYKLCRLNEHLECITTHISKRDKYIKIYINIFNLTPTPESLMQLKGLSGMNYGLSPSNRTEMRLRIDDSVGPPIFRILFGKEHKLGFYWSETGFNNRVKQLGDLIQNDMNNIDYFVKRWYEIHKRPAQTNWEGVQV